MNFIFLCESEALILRKVFLCGQVFRWKLLNNNEWLGIIDENAILLKQDDDNSPVLFKIVGGIDHNHKDDKDKMTKRLVDYFQLNLDYKQLLSQWKDADEVFRKRCGAFGRGFRVIRQSPIECLFSFICSSNNNIGRISGMIDRFCKEYGTAIDIISETGNNTIYSFPTLTQIQQKASESKLRELGFGYRAKFIVHSAAQIVTNGGDKWLENLRRKEISNLEAEKQLTTLFGVGRKVADCVMLFSLDKSDIIPVDTHVWTITARDFLPSLKDKSLSKDIYDKIQELYKKKFGEYCGFCHSVMFACELPVFRNEVYGDNETINKNNREGNGGEKKKKKKKMTEKDDEGDEQDSLNLNIKKRKKE